MLYFKVLSVSSLSDTNRIRFKYKCNLELDIHTEETVADYPRGGERAFWETE